MDKETLRILFKLSQALSHFSLMHPENLPVEYILPGKMQDYFWEHRVELYGSVEYPVYNLIHRINILEHLRLISQASASHDILVKVLELALRETGPMYKNLVKGIKEIRGSDTNVAKEAL